MADNQNNDWAEFTVGGMFYKTRLTKKFKNRQSYEEKDPKLVKAYIPGTIVEIYVRKGSSVKEGQPMLILEAMKMRNVVTAPFDGKVKQILVKKMELVGKNQLILEME